MLYEKIPTARRLDMVDVVAAWPVSAQIAPIPIPDLEPEPMSQPERHRGEHRDGDHRLTRR